MNTMPHTVKGTIQTEYMEDAAEDTLVFFFVTLKPRVERCNNL